MSVLWEYLLENVCSYTLKLKMDKMNENTLSHRHSNNALEDACYHSILNYFHRCNASNQNCQVPHRILYTLDELNEKVTTKYDSCMFIL